jgi:hypothetical protein
MIKIFRIKTQVQSLITLEYSIEADSLEEAMDLLREGEVRGEGIMIDDETDWGTEEILEYED